MFGFLTFGSALAFLDLALKNQIEIRKDEEFPRELPGTKGLIHLYKNHNSGFSFGLLKECRKAVEIVPLCITSALAGVFAYLSGKKGRRLEKLAVTLALAGGVSNLYDRMKRGYVVDYLNVRWKCLGKLVFNLADFMIALGAGLFVASSAVDAAKEIIEERKEAKG